MFERTTAGGNFLPVRIFAGALLLAIPAFAGQGAPPSPLPGAAPVSLKLQPAEITPAATKAMMLSTARAGKRMVAVGDRGIVLLSDDDGGTFRQAKSVPVRSTLTAVCFADERTGWAVGHWGIVLRTDDAGENWKVQRSDTSVDQPLFSVYFRDKDQGWAVGLWSLMVTTRDGGKTWNRVRLPASPGGRKADRNLLKIFSSRIGTLLVAAEQGVVLRSIDGENWTVVDTGYKGSFWTGIALSNGTLMVGGLRGTIYRSADEGRTWRESKTDLKSSITDIAEAGGKIIAVGLDGVILESDNGGATFKGTQRGDRLPFTALAISNNGRLVKFSKQGIVEDPPPAPSK
ncbi:MAG: glycosyl hydrolase [Deltaproteobacteria bacterium]|nr:MAG: glycosyl hydrolase [Deltaproteobacteria bacterium]